ncbi:Lipopolysaccharide biosynthesis protein, LPS:glycosyltransferase [Chryseolinea serpens]|uniref:Lipopolysaccharide biosynthesis protein, LPS:glycosyltransferase n=1 Tax=Chryseolinea serpens TaxID=947013 RepID=A0A1M5NCS5_9BACT|nr:glycosyltransferase family 8 protein [Chryseolinea serpens]SHG87374.1 Lipopolysaccharide biosynthesis protein, LPS:glycosyltransferase [Chryseolinea serpens]
MKTLHLAAAFDQHYRAPFYAWFYSVLDHHANTSVHFHLIATGIPETEKQDIADIARKHRVFFYNIDEAFTARFVLGSKWTPAVYYRLFFPFLVPPAVERLLYLDVDTIVLADLTDFYSLDLGGKPLGAVYDNYVITQPLLGINEPGNYFNSGVMLMDLNQWRQTKISEQVIDYLLKYPETIRFVDQCGLNAILVNAWKKLDERYNYLYSYVPQERSFGELKELLRDKYVVHFTLDRPWEMLCRNRLRFLYFEYRKKWNGRTSKYTDFAWSKVPAWLRIRAIEFYFDTPWIRMIWRALKPKRS